MLDSVPETAPCRPALSFLSQEFTDAAQERRYRDEGYIDYQRHTLTGMAILILGCGFLGFVDLMGMLQGGGVGVPLVSRVSMVALAILFSLFMLQKHFSPLEDAVAALLLCVLGLLTLAIEAIRPPDYLAHVGLDTLFVIAIYLISPIPLRLQLVPALLFSVGEFFLLALLRTDIDAQSLYISSMGLVGANMIGVVFSRRMARHHRERYHALTQERHARVQLESALAQVDTLSELLPICSVCKKVRDDHGYWSSVEKYLHEHFHQELTHGLCPDCFQSQTKNLRSARPVDIN